MIVGLYEDRNGERFVEIHKDKDNLFTISFPKDDLQLLPFERLEHLKTALADVIWNKGRSIPA